MSIFGSVVVLTIAWWIAFQALLPWGVRSQAEGDDIVPGSDPGAPQRPDMRKKIVAATIIAVVVWAIAFVAISSVPLEDWPTFYAPPTRP